MALIVDFSDLGGYKALILKPYQGFAKVCAFGNPLILNCNQNFMGLLKNPFFFKRQIGLLKNSLLGGYRGLVV